MLDPYEQLSPEGLIKGDVRQISTPGLLSDTSMERFEGLNFINTQYHIKIFPISSFNQENPTPVWVILVIDVASDCEVVEDNRDVFLILIHDANRSIIMTPDKILLLWHTFLKKNFFSLISRQENRIKSKLMTTDYCFHFYICTCFLCLSSLLTVGKKVPQTSQVE